ncbi:TPA: hypothetical protein ACH3X1_008857 [Trebouxia sp. C0004]
MRKHNRDPNEDKLVHPRTMGKFTSKEIKREHAFGKLIRGDGLSFARLCIREVHVFMANPQTSSAGYGMTSVDMKVRLYCPNSTSEQSRHVSIKSQPFELPGHGITLITVQDLQIHYQHAAGSTKKLNFLGPDREQLPGPLWDPETWTSPRRLAASGKLVYVATDRHKQQQVIKFTKQYGWDVHRAWATADLAPKLLLSPDPIAGRWQQIQMEYLPSRAGWLTMRFLMLPVND